MSLLVFLMSFVAWQEKKVSFGEFFFNSPVPMIALFVSLAPIFLVAFGGVLVADLGVTYLAAAQGLGICLLIGTVNLLLVFGLSRLASRRD